MSNIEQTFDHPIGTITRPEVAIMEKPTNKNLRRLEANSPLASADWRPRFWRFGEDERVPYEELRKQLNRVDDSVLLRIARNSDSN